ncbi:MAG: HlyD family efflux transporter periplasmic adaptor subunit [Chloroflexota bacterium]
MHRPPAFLAFRSATVSPPRSPATTPTPSAASDADRAQPAPPPQPPAPARRLHSHLPVMLLLALVLGVASWLAYDTWRLGQGGGPLTASGTTEADEVLVSSEVAGRILSLPFEEGARVRAGDVVATLDDALLRLQMTQVDAATQRQLDIQLDKYVLRAPADGVVTRVPARIGETALPGQPLLAFADLRRLKVTVYVLERDLGGVRVGQPVLVTADPFPNQTFSGVVTSINQRAEFTPRNVQTQRDRLNLVFGVKVRVENPTYALKPGMPIDATFQPLDELTPEPTSRAVTGR